MNEWPWMMLQAYLAGWRDSHLHLEAWLRICEARDQAAAARDGLGIAAAESSAADGPAAQSREPRCNARTTRRAVLKV